MTDSRAPLLGEALPVELMNTIWADRDGVHDALAGTDEALAWLRAIAPRLAPVPAEAAEWLRSELPDRADAAAAHLRRLRDAVRRLAADATGDTRDVAGSASLDRSSALRVLERACAAAPTWSTLEWAADGEPLRVVHSSAAPGPIVAAVLAAHTVDLFAGELRSRLQACHAPGCVLYFVKQHPRREWCSAGCGNRARVARHYRRHRTDAGIGR